MARWFVSFQAINPKDLATCWEVGVSERHYRSLQNHGHEKAIARLMLVKEVLKGGTIEIYSGWSRPDKQDCFVYTGRPRRDFRSLRIETPPDKRLIFLVFVLPDGEIDEWTWRCLAEDGKRPEGVSGDLIWSVNPS